ncbi:hypothetical protein TRIP_E280342 [uncultured Spirochaetota bacterium]|nr:hypothetical protein TRIP_E280342 [uncultured Spirochaetota bacterium]
MVISIFWPKYFSASDARTLVLVSTAPPAAKVTIISTGLVGKMVCALKEIKIENKRIKMKKIDFEKVEIPFFLKLHISTLLKKLKILYSFAI